MNTADGLDVVLNDLLVIICPVKKSWALDISNRHVQAILINHIPVNLCLIWIFKWCFTRS